MRKILFLVLLVGSLSMSSIAWGQVKISKVLSLSKINRHQDSHLVLIDFWATWCVPCINIGKQLEITQETFKEDLTIISLSNESEPVVQRFIDTQHPKLTIALDAENQTFDCFEVDKSLPYAVLLNQKGQVLWKGHPGSLSNAMIDKFVQKCEPLSTSPTPFIALSRKKEDPEVRQVPHESARDDQFSVTPSTNQDSYCYVSADGLKFSGKVSSLISEIMKTSLHDIVLENDRFVQANIGLNYWNLGPEIVLAKIMTKLDLSREIRYRKTKHYWLSVTNPNLLWDSMQLNLADYDGAFMIGGESLSLDNATIEELAFRLSGVMDHPVYTDNDSPVLHDWLVHYKYFGMTKEQLENEYGIGIELRTGTHPLNYFK